MKINKPFYESALRKLEEVLKKNSRSDVLRAWAHLNSTQPKAIATEGEMEITNALIDVLAFAVFRKQ